MTPKNIALLAGGYSGEFVISLKTAENIQKQLPADKYNVFKIIINKEGWFHEHGTQKISVDKNDFSLTIAGTKIRFEAAFIAMHGTPGEDGRIQGYLDMMDIPYTTCNTIVSALTFNKNNCNKVVKDAHIVGIANSVLLFKDQPYSIGMILEHLRMPLFVKPNESGSSLGISKVNSVEDLLPAIEKAFKEDTQVLIEEFIEGRELTIGVYHLGDQLQALPPTEIVLGKSAIFDFDAKYSEGDTREVTPARIEDDTLKELSSKACQLYRYLNCRGVVRMDFILQKGTNKLFFLEVNTMPGQTEASIVPQQLRCAGIELTDFYTALLEDALNRR
ncbi:MAG: D-alanine--D-alanine ligase [Chitinophagaceae bacterium]